MDDNYLELLQVQALTENLVYALHTINGKADFNK